MISIIIPSYNYGHLIGETIESVLNQSYTDLELIVIDDGSTDLTKEVVQNLSLEDPRIRYFKYENVGLGASRNRGLEKVQGDYIQFLDADDLIEKEKFKIQLEIFKDYPELDVVYGSVRYFTNEPFNHMDRLFTYWGPNKEWMPKIQGSGPEFTAKAFKGNFSHLSSPLFKRELVLKVGNFNNEMSAVADYHFLLRCVLMGANFHYHDDLGTYSLVRWHPNNMSRNVDMMRREEQKMRLTLNENLVAFPSVLESNQQAIKSLEYQLGKSWKRHFLSGGKFDFIKKIITSVGLNKLFLRLFYKNS
jgi:glycosyltransferase involved in cell wall biosynthesis